MKAVFRHELSSCFSNVTAYVFDAFLLLFAGIYTMVYNLSSAVTNFEYVLGSMSFVYLVAVPILTMRVLAEERKQKTDQLLYALPISITKVILGKYCAMLVVLLVPVAVLCTYPLILSAYGDVYLPAAYCAIAGFFLLGAALIAVGMFLSSVTESQAVSAGLCFAVMLVNYFLSDLADYVSTSATASLVAFAVVILIVAILVRLMTKSTLAALTTGVVLEAVLGVVYLFYGENFAGLFPAIVKELSLFERFYDFVNGVFDLTGVVYFLSVSGFFVFLSVQSMEKRRWSE